MRGTESPLQAARELQLTYSDQRPVHFHGKTMLPLLQEADEVIVKPVEWSQIRPGDVLTYRFEEKYPTRRVIFIDRANEQLIIKGDSLSLRQRYIVSRADILGRAVARCRDGKWLKDTHLEWQAIKFRVLARNYVFAIWQKIRRVMKRRAPFLLN